jgi:hypothetical protein
MERALVSTHPRFQELERLGNEIAELSAHLDAATARLLELIREFDARDGWDGARSCADWLSWRVGLDLGAARERVRVARALGGLPLISAALARGDLSYSKVRALTRVATPQTEARLLEVGRAGTAAHVEKIVRGWRYVDRQVEAKEAKARHWGRTLQVYTDEDGMLVVRGRLAPEAGAVLVRALEAARATLYPPGRTVGDPKQGAVADPSTVGQQQADALALVAETALEHGLGADPRSERHQVVVHVDAALLADPAQPGQSVLEDGARSRGNGAAPGMGGDADRDAPRGGRRGARRGAADADDPAGTAAGIGGAGSRVSLSRLRRPSRAEPPRSPLGEWRSHAPEESRVALSASLPGGARGGLHGGAGR